MQEIRTKKFRNITENMVDEILISIFHKKFKTRNLIRDYSRNTQIKMIEEDINDFAEIIYNMKWLLLINKTKTPFWTSDHPVARYNDCDYLGNLGLDCVGIQVYFPLNPELTLVIIYPYMWYTSLLSSEYEIEKVKIIEELNFLQFKSSLRHIFSNNNDFSAIEKYSKCCKDNSYFHIISSLYPRHKNYI